MRTHALRLRLAYLMRRLLLAPLILALSSPLQAEPIPKISDFEISLAEPWRLDFICPFKKETVFEDGQRKTKKIGLYEECWVDFYKDHMDVMGLQRIDKKDVVKFWLQIEGYVGAKYVYNFLYRDKTGKLLSFAPTRNVNWNNQQDNKLIVNSRGKKVWFQMHARNVIKTWLAQ